MKRLSILFLLLFIQQNAISIEGKPQPVKVKYLSSDHVYLDGGTGEGLMLGDTLSIERDKAEAALLEIIYIATHSASCKILSSQGEIALGDPAIFIGGPRRESPEIEDTATAVQIPTDIETPQPEIEGEPEKPAVRLKGSVALQTYYQNDTGPANFDFSQPALRVNLKAANIWRTGYTLSVRTRTRYTARSRDYSPSVPREQWRNRIYEFSFSNDEESDGVHFRMGRIIANKISGIGYIDGALVQKKISRLFTAGLFTGTQPDWQYADIQTSLQKYGAYLNYEAGDYKSRRYESTLAVAAEYHRSIVSREFIYFQNSFRLGDRLSFFQNSDVDINRSWRKEKAGGTLALSNFMMSARFRPADPAELEIRYDNRRNYWTYELRDYDESLFDAFTSTGLRLNLNLRLPGKFFTSAGYGYRKRQADIDATNSYRLSLRRSNLTKLRLNWNLQLSGFSGETNEGYSLSARLGKYFRAGHGLSVAYSSYVYNYKTIDTRRKNDSYELETNIRLLSRVYVMGQYKYGIGDDINGHTVILTTGWRF